MASNNSDPAPLKRGVEVSNKLDNDTTTIRVVYTHRPGLHADLAVCVDGQKFLRILRSEVTRHGHLRVHRFWVVDVVTHKKLPHALLTPLSLSVRDAVVDPGIWARWFGVENAKRRAAIDHENENRGDKGVGATLTIPVDAVPSALRDLALCALAKGVDFDELRSGVPRQSHDGHLQFHVEVSLRCGDGDDAGLAAHVLGTHTHHKDLVPIGLRQMVDGAHLKQPIDASLALKHPIETSQLGEDRHHKPVTSPTPAKYDNGTTSPLTSTYRSTRGPGSLQRAESIADLSRFQIAGTSVHDVSAHRMSPAPAPASPAPVSPAPYQTRSNTCEDRDCGRGTGGHAGQHSGMLRSLSVAEMGATDGRVAPPVFDAASRVAERRLGGGRVKRLGNAIPHASSIADLAAMQGARGGDHNVGAEISLRRSLCKTQNTNDRDSPDSRSPSRLGRVSQGTSPPPGRDEMLDHEMLDADGSLPGGSGYGGYGQSVVRAISDQDERDQGLTKVPDHRCSADGTSVARVLDTANRFLTRESAASLPVAQKTLFGHGRFPDLPQPKRNGNEHDYHLLRELGRGLCGTVYLAEEKRTKRIVAFKVMRKTKLVDVGEATHASEERKLHERISTGPFINRLLDSFQDPWALFLVLEYAPCGDLFQAMNFHGLPSRDDARVYAAQVAIALEHLHLLGYVYRDLKPENILLHPHGSAQLADFGMAKRISSGGGVTTATKICDGHLDSGYSDRTVSRRTPSPSFGKTSNHDHHQTRRTYTICGTAQYMSPEVLLHKGCGFEADLWALGIFIYELVTGDTPFSGISGSRQELYRKLMSHDPDTMEMPHSVDGDTSRIVRALLRNDESTRLGAGGDWGGLFSHGWFGGLDCEAVKTGAIVPALSPRKRNVITDLALRKLLDKGDAPWRRGVLLEDPTVKDLFDAF